jgi:hypothetical protein
MTKKPRRRATVTDITGGLRLSLSVLAREMGISRDKLRDLLHRNKVQPAGDRSGHPVFHLRDAFRLLSVPSEAVDPATLPAFERAAYWRAENERMRAMEQARELIPRIEVEQESARCQKIVVQALETLPDVIERDCGVPGAVVERIEERIDQLRRDLYACVMTSSLQTFVEGTPIPDDIEAAS